ncbi:MAG: class I SAM-dependent methyltransferase [Anaerolineales bacterium]|nr:MAG: class I SAM-dependent methyltransferase [Anaerolineales bacterium]
MKFVCPRCRAELQKITEAELLCLRDWLTFEQRDGIWRFLLPERESHYARFIADYETVRRAEGRFSADASYYRSLPFKDLSGRFSADWRIRAASFRALKGLLRAESKVLDVGAGNGWLSNRLSSLGHHVWAADLLVNPEDGLGAWTFYETKFAPVQAEFIHLPFAEQSVDAVIFNASFHYSERYEVTLRESLRVLSPTGRVIIMDTPVYRDTNSGVKMLEERSARFLAGCGFASDSIASEGFLTYARLDELGRTLGIRWRHVRPFYGLRWVLRPWLARLRGGREPAEFGLWVGEIGKPV